MQFVTASDTAVFMSASSSIVGSNCDANAATVILANASFAPLFKNYNSVTGINFRIPLISNIFLTL